MRNLYRISITFCIVVLVVTSQLGAFDCPGAASEGWDAGDVNGWQGGSGTVIGVVPSGGNPDGYLSGENAGLIMIMSSTPPFAGNYATGGIREISVDTQLLSGTSVVGPAIRLRKDASSNGWFFNLADTITPDGLWHTYTVPVNPAWSDQDAENAGWQPMDSPVVVSFADTMASVGYLIFWDNQSVTGDIAGFDNVTLACPLFADSFESGNISGWSSSAN